MNEARKIRVDKLDGAEAAAKIQLEHIPQSLRADTLWCCWKFEEREGKKTKVPYNPRTGGRAMSNEKSTFGSFEQALFAYDMGGYDGIGIGMFDTVCGIDIDHCVDENGKPSKLASYIMNEMNSYAEYSPSGTGIHVLFKASGIEYDKGKYYTKNPRNGVELYLAGATNRFFTVTGRALRASGLNERSHEVGIIMDQFMRRRVRQRPAPIPSTQPAVSLSDDDLIQIACAAKNGTNFSRLMQGDTTAYGGDDSRADLALCCLLAFYTKDPEQIDRIFRSSSLLRDKWDRKTGTTTYGQMTVEKALSFITQQYTPGKSGKSFEKHRPRRKLSLTEQVSGAQSRAAGQSPPRQHILKETEPAH